MSSEVELVPASITNRNNHVSKVRIITENGQTYDYWNVSVITTTSDCIPMNKTVNSEEESEYKEQSVCIEQLSLINEIVDNMSEIESKSKEQSVWIDQLSLVNEIVDNISQQCLQLTQDDDLHTDKSIDTLGLTQLTSKDRETLIGLINPMINEVRDLREFIHSRRRIARDRLISAKRAGTTLYSDDDFSGFQSEDLTNNIQTISSPIRPRTRSQGPVKDLSWVVQQPIEYPKKLVVPQ